MEGDIPMQVVEGAARLATRSASVKRLFELTSGKQRNQTDMNVDYLENTLGISRGEAVGVAKSLQAVGCGRFIIGRKGARSRFQWSYSAIDISRKALGVSAAEGPSAVSLATEVKIEPSGGSEFPSQMSISEAILKAKEALSLEIGIPASSIEIKITL